MTCLDCGIPLHSDRPRCPGCTLQRVAADQRQPAAAEWFDREPEREVRRVKRRAAMAQRVRALEQELAAHKLALQGSGAVVLYRLETERRRRIETEAARMLGGN